MYDENETSLHFCVIFICHLFIYASVDIYLKASKHLSKDRDFYVVSVRRNYIRKELYYMSASIRSGNVSD